ncbi:hypothetical protein GGU10DRAFT_416604 [Lentinula aff. detonsa]|nr:hypothetical protein GGU10DRAFT_416604 [Lentinula aff. detonsa]
MDSGRRLGHWGHGYLWLEYSMDERRALYPTDNCYAQYGTGTPRNDTELRPTYLMHTSAQSLIQPYLNSTAYAQSKSKPFIMFETNTASCAPPTNQSSYKQWTVGPIDKDLYSL